MPENLRAPQPKPADGSAGDTQVRGISAFLKSTGLLRPATTSHFLLYFYPHEPLLNFLNQKVGAGAAKLYDSEKLGLLCSEAALPGSSIATHEINNNYTGVTERHGYRRLYDDRANFTFYVDHDYTPITFFETWMQYVAGEQITQGLADPEYFYRFNYPGTKGDGYRMPRVALSKFEKDYSGSYLQYTFLDAFPIGLNSIPVSYENSQLLKCTVSMAFTRYVMKYEPFRYLQSEKPGSTGAAPAVPEGVRPINPVTGKPVIRNTSGFLTDAEWNKAYSSGVSQSGQRVQPTPGVRGPRER